MTKPLILYVDILRRFHYIFITIWLGIAISSAFFVMDFINTTTIAFDPPTTTKAYQANQIRAQYFPYSKHEADMSLFAKISDEALLLSGSSASSSSSCLAKISSPEKRKSVMNKNITSVVDIPSVQLFVDALTVKAIELYPSVDVANYFFLKSIGAVDLAQQLLSNRSTLLLLPVILPVQFTSVTTRNFAHHLVEAKNKYEASILKNVSLNLEAFGGEANRNFTECVTNSLSSGGSGVPLMESEMVEASKKDLAKMDAIVIPIAMCVMAYTVKSVRLLILPILSIGLSLSVSFAVMYPIAKTIAVSSASPSLMMSLCIAMGIDYNLFLLSRFVEEVRNGHKGAAAVANTLATAGHTVLISGLTLTVSFIALIFFPTNLLQSFGIGCSLTIFIALLISLNLTPAILICFFNFMENAAFDAPLPRCMPQWRIFENFGFYLVGYVDGDDNNKNNNNAGGGGGDTTPHQKQIMSNDDLSITSPVPTLEAQEGFSTVARATTAHQQQRAVAATGGAEASSNNKASSSSPSSREQQQQNKYNDDAVASPTLRLNHDSKGRASNNIIDSPTNSKTRLASSDVIVPVHQQQRGGGDNNNNNNNIPTEFDPSINPIVASSLLDSTAYLSGTGNANNTANNNNLVIERERAAHYGDSVGSSILFKLQPLLTFPWNVVSVLLLSGLVGFVGHYTLELQLTDEMSSFLPRGGAERKDFLMLKEEFGAGSVNPYHILFVLPEDSDINRKNNFSDIVTNESVFSLAQSIVLNFANVTSTDLSHFQGAFAVGGQLVTRGEVAACESKNETEVYYDCNKNVLMMLSNRTLSANRRAALVTFISDVDPTGNDGHTFYNLMLDAATWRPTTTAPGDDGILQKYKQEQPHMEIYLMGVGPDSMDTISAVYDHFPLIAVMACVAVMIMVGIAFRSIVVPLRCIISIAFTEAFVFGFSVLVYQKGIFDFMKDPSVHGTGAISWLTPIVVFCIVIGVALDYDIFLLTRVTEYIAHEGVSTREGTLLGLCATGGIITAAGFTMAVAFFGLLLTQMLLVNELGFMLVVAVLFDTFIVRTLLVPSVMSLLGKWHWWPSNLEGSAFSHIFQPSDSISARASLVGSGSDQQQNTNIYYGTAGRGGAGSGGDYQPPSRGLSDNVFNPVDTGRVNKSAQLLEQQKQRLQHLFGGE